FALRPRSVVVGHFTFRGGLTRERDELRLHETQAEHLGVGDRRRVDGAPSLDRYTRKIRAGFLVERFGRCTRLGEHGVRRDAGRLRVDDAVIETATFEVVPETREPLTLRVQPAQSLVRICKLGFCGTKLRIDGLTSRELSPVLFREMRLAL